MAALAEATPVDDPGFFEIADLEAAVRDLGSRFRDASLDALVERAQKAAANLSDLDAQVVKDRVTRTNDPDPYGFLVGL